MIKIKYFWWAIFLWGLCIVTLYVEMKREVKTTEPTCTPDTVMVHDTVIWSNTMGDGCFMDGEFLPEAVK